MTQSERIPNRLINESSPYLQQHAYNPVGWYPWREKKHLRKQSLKISPFSYLLGIRSLSTMVDLSLAPASSMQVISFVYAYSPRFVCEALVFQQPILNFNRRDTFIVPFK